MAAIEEVALDKGSNSRVRKIIIALFIVLGVLSSGAYVAVHWVEHQILNTDNWVALVSPLPKQPAVSQALGTYIGQQVIAGANVQQRIADALPPKASFLASPLAGQINSLTIQASQKVVASDGFQTVWAGANRVAMDRLVSQARGQQTALQSKVQEKFNVNISGATGQLRGALNSAANALPALQPAANKAISVTTDLHARAQRVHQVIRTLDLLNSVLPFAIFASFLAALALSARRRRTAMTAVVSVIVMMLLELIALKFLKQQTLAQVQNSANLPAVGLIYDALVASLKHSIYAVIVLMLIIEGLLLAAGPARWAQTLRSKLHLDRIERSQAVAVLHRARNWTRRWEHYLWAGAIGLILAIVALFTAEVDNRVLFNSVLLAITLLALLHIIATPHYRMRRGLT